MENTQEEQVTLLLMCARPTVASELNTYAFFFLVIIPQITQYDSYVHSIHIVLGIRRNLELI